MTDSYREQPLRCPACGDLLEPRVLSGSTVDTCPKCRGLWVDWYDGDLLAIVKETGPLSSRSPVEIDHLRSKCPRCGEQLSPEAFNGIVLLRCAECAGCFVPRESFGPLIDLDLPADTDKQNALSRLVLTIRRLFGAEPTVKINVTK